MIEEQRQGAARFYLIADCRALSAYGLGLVCRRPGIHRPFVEKGYLVQAGTVRGLASAISINPDVLAATIKEFNRDATALVDRRFGKGESSYNRAMGDPSAAHPCLAPLDTVRFLPSESSRAIAGPRRAS